MLKESEILQFMQEDATSEKKQFARVGQRYYDGEHDIKNYKLYYYDADGNLVEDEIRSNIKISHPFFTELIDQTTQYLLSSKDGFMHSDIPKLQNELDEYFNNNENFTAELYELITGSQTKGFEYMYAYKNEDDRLAFQCADSIGVVEVRERDTDDGCKYVIYWYIDRIEKGQKKIKRIQVWGESQTAFYTQDDEGKIIPDNCYNGKNIKPHIIFEEGKDKYFEGFGFIPFFRLDNCRKQLSSLKSIKDLIDDYDLHACSLSNNLVDFDTPIHVVRGFRGDKLDELIENMKIKKHIALDSDGGVDIQTVSIPFEARLAKLELDEKNIYRFGMGLNTAGLKDTNATTNIAIQTAYALLDMKCNKIQIKLEEFLRKILKVVLKEINEREDADYRVKDVWIDFGREIMTNANDNAQISLLKAQTEQVKITTLLNLATTLDSETIVQNICDVLDIDYEKIKTKLPKTPEAQVVEAQAQLDGVLINES